MSSPLSECIPFYRTPPPGVEPGCPKGPALKAGAIPLCDGGLLNKINRKIQFKRILF